ncbi:hypothetical protein M404DRAFT_629588 [Pisolithus tinctorius Marx 270]|uniref:Uncharacterized protein n=1 Tax=Pisolithus tinctorius Marx 270 TaxID=870435 RepID=A0A0C3P6J7_PISTI|nr:hypothetical protein M404DRAFT_629588 [Pisolithus tinctorius Marx 270]
MISRGGTRAEINSPPRLSYSLGDIYIFPMDSLFALGIPRLLRPFCQCRVRTAQMVLWPKF